VPEENEHSVLLFFFIFLFVNSKVAKLDSQLVVCAKCRWAGKPDQFRTNQGLLVALTARNVAAAEGRKYADIEAKFQQLQSQFTT